MTEDKAVKALRKVIINLLPLEYSDGPIPNDALLSIDITDKLTDNTIYRLANVFADYGAYNKTVDYIPYEKYKKFKESVEDILNVAIVNGKQRESMQRMLDQAFWSSERYNDGV